MPLLRGHHLICLHFFTGEGYSEEFIRNLVHILKRAEAEETEVISGPDDVCSKCPYLKNARCMYDDNAEEEILRMDEVATKMLKIVPGNKLRWNTMRDVIPEIFQRWHGLFCIQCDWRIACEKSELFNALK